MPKPFIQAKKVEKNHTVTISIPLSTYERLCAYEATKQTPKAEIITTMLKVCFDADEKFQKDFESGKFNDLVKGQPTIGQGSDKDKPAKAGV